jgi:hypothetical protein
MRFHAFWPLFQTRLFLDSRGLGIGDKEVMQRHTFVSEFRRKVVCVNMLRRGESSSLCMKFESFPSSPTMA